MHFKDFTLELLVNGQPLKEHNLPLSEVNGTDRDRTYVVDKISKECEYSEFATYAAVVEPGVKYAIRYSARNASEENPIITSVFIDGNYDKIHRTLKNSSFKMKTEFWNAERNMKLNFKFANTIWTEDDGSRGIMDSGDPGCIVIKFYDAVKVSTRKPSNRRKSQNVAQVKVPETKKNIDVSLTTEFVEGESTILYNSNRSRASNSNHSRASNSNHSRASNSNYSCASKHPIACLCLHYRPVSWFVVRGLYLGFTHLPVSNPVIGLNVDVKKKINSEELISSSSRNLLKRSGEVIKVEDEDCKIIDSTSFSSPKRVKSEPIIYVLDSDDEVVEERK